MARQTPRSGVAAAPPVDDATRTALREEILLHEEIRKELATHQASKPGLFATLNSPFVITLLGGFLIAFMGHYWQSQQTLHESRLDLIRRFPTQYNAEFAIELQGYTLHRWLANLNQGAGAAPTGLRAPAGVTREQVINWLNEDWKLSLSQPTDSSLLSEARALFAGDRRVEQAAEELVDEKERWMPVRGTWPLDSEEAIAGAKKEVGTRAGALMGAMIDAEVRRAGAP